MSRKIKDKSVPNEEQEIIEDGKINYTDFLKDTEAIEKEIKEEEELKKQKKREKFRKAGTEEITVNTENANDIDLDNDELKRADGLRKKIISAICAAGVLILIYTGVAYGYYSNRYLPSTVINGEDCGGKTVEEVAEIMEKRAEDYHLNIEYNDIVVDELYGRDIDLSFGDMDVVLEDICDNQKKLSWLKGVVADSKPINTSKGLEYNANVLNQFINSSLVLGMTSTVKSENAGLEFKDGEYVIKPAVYGDEINKAAFIDIVTGSVNSLNTTVDINNGDCFIKPELTEENKTLIKSCDDANELIENKIELNITDDVFEIPVDIKKDWLNVDNEGNLMFDESAFAKYMDRLDKSYSYSEDEREFETFHGDSVTVKGGDFNQAVNRDKLTANMSQAMLEKGDKRVVAEFVYYDNKDIGNSYIEIDLSNQMLWMFVNGEQVVGTPVVTGLDDGEHNTPEGIYRLKSKSENALVTDKGEEKEVKYYISVNGDIGICDASWLDMFGGNTYKDKGSEGSVYVSEDAAKDIYSNCYEDMPVIMYHHEIVENFFIEDSYMGELMYLIENRPEIPVYDGEDTTEETTEDTTEETNEEENTEEEVAEETEAAAVEQSGDEEVTEAADEELVEEPAKSGETGEAPAEEIPVENEASVDGES